MTPPPPPPARASSLPLVGMIVSGVGLMLPPLLLVGLVIGVVALVKKKGSQVQALLAVLIPLVAAMIFGILLVIALPKYRASVAGSKAVSAQRECRVNLKSAYTGQRSYFEEFEKYDEHPAVIDFAPERGNDFAYLFAAAGPVPAHSAAVAAGDVGVGIDPVRGSNDQVLAAIPSELRGSLGLRGTCPECSMTMLCAANLDEDPKLDLWTISTADRPGVPKGVPHHVSDDLTP